MLQFSDQVFITVCTFLTSLAVAALNNRHQTRLRRLEYQLQQQQTDAQRRQQALNDYLRAAGACMQVSVTNEQQSDLGSRTSAAIPFVASDALRKQMFEYLSRMQCFHEPTDRDAALLAEITEGIRKELTA